MESWRQQLYSDVLFHHGVKGQKWGVRRYQPYPDGKSGRYLGNKSTKIRYGYDSPYKTKLKEPKRYYVPLTRIRTKAGREYDKERTERWETFSKERGKEIKETSKDVEKIIKSMSSDDQDKIGITSDRAKEYANDGFAFVKRFVLTDDKNTPVSFLDLERHGYSGMNVVIGTRGGNQYRNKGYATELSKTAMEWIEKNQDYLEFPVEYLTWNARSDNKGSRKLAENNGFKLDYIETDEHDREEAYYRKDIKHGNMETGIIR